MEMGIRPDLSGGRPAVTPQRRSQPFFPVPSHAPVWRVLRSSIVRGEGVICITGASGSGKSLFLHRLQGILPENRDMALIDEPECTTSRFLELLIRALDPEWEPLSPESQPTSEDLLDALERRVNIGRRLLVAVDEAHLLSPENAALLEHILRFASQDVRPVQVLLCGSYELTPLLASSPYHSLGRLTVGSGEVTPLTRSEVWDYSRFLLRKHWGDHYRLSRFAWVEIYSRSQGNPGKINQILHQVAAILKVRPQKVISRKLICRAIDGEPDGASLQRFPASVWVVALSIIALMGWWGIHTVSGRFSKSVEPKKTQDAQQVVEKVDVEEVLQKKTGTPPTATPKESEKPAGADKTAAAATPPAASSSAPSRVLYSPVAPPDAKNPNANTAPWVPRDRKHSGGQQTPSSHASAQTEAGNTQKHAAEPAPAKKIDSGTIPAEKLVVTNPFPSAAPVKQHPPVPPVQSVRAEETPAPVKQPPPVAPVQSVRAEETPAPVKQPPPVAKDKVTATEPRSFPIGEPEEDSDEVKTPVPVPNKSHESPPPVATKPALPKPGAASEDVPVPEPLPVSAESSPPSPPVPTPLNVTKTGTSTEAVPTPDPIGRSVAAIMEENKDTPVPPEPPVAEALPKESVKTRESLAMAVPTPLKKQAKASSTPEKDRHPPPPPRHSAIQTTSPTADGIALVKPGIGGADPMQKPPTPLISEENLKSAGQLFVVQTGSFRNREYAERLASVMASKGLETYVHVMTKENKKWYSVRVNYRDSKTALRVADQVKKDVGLPTQVIDLFYE
ncbi:MAG: AAA family ATPase [Magnetococcales bacterium]|nr:AAA family ATPase [Magnetococcales bacterium]